MSDSNEALIKEISQLHSGLYSGLFHSSVTEAIDAAIREALAQAQPSGYSAADMSTAAADGFRDGRRAAEPICQHVWHAIPATPGSAASASTAECMKCGKAPSCLLDSTPPDTVPRSELEGALLERDTAIGMVDEARVLIAELQAKAVPASITNELEWCIEHGNFGARTGKLMNRIKEYLSAAPAPAASPVVPEACEWHEDTDGEWQSDCGAYYSINDDTPEKNGMKFCLGCGKPLRTILPDSGLIGIDF